MAVLCGSGARDLACVVCDMCGSRSFFDRDGGHDPEELSASSTDVAPPRVTRSKRDLRTNVATLATRAHI